MKQRQTTNAWMLALLCLTVVTGCSDSKKSTKQSNQAQSNQPTKPRATARADKNPPAVLANDLPEVIKIPLTDIWATYMPGTRKIREMDWSKLEKPKPPLSTGSIALLQRLGQEKSKPGFVVQGIDEEAEIAAHKKLPPGESPTNVLPAGTKLSLVYFSHEFGSRILLHKVERRGELIEIQYRFDATGTDDAYANYALIPLGKLPAGEYQVKITESPEGRFPQLPPQTRAALPLVVCQPFSFSVTDSHEHSNDSKE